MTSVSTIRAMRAGERELCEKILRALPDWFGIEEALVQYVADSETYPTWIAERDAAGVGFITVRRHFPLAAEVHCMAVSPEFHRSGIGRAMIAFVERSLRDDGCEYLQVKTLGPSRPNEHYDRTRAFYAALGFRALEEFPELWPGNPCLLMVKRL